METETHPVGLGGRISNKVSTFAREVKERYKGGKEYLSNSFRRLGEKLGLITTETQREQDDDTTETKTRILNILLQNARENIKEEGKDILILTAASVVARAIKRTSVGENRFGRGVVDLANLAVALRGATNLEAILALVGLVMPGLNPTNPVLTYKKSKAILGTIAGTVRDVMETKTQGEQVETEEA